MSLIYPTVNLLARPGVQPTNLVVGRNVAATCINALGQVETVDPGRVRHDFDPATGRYRGWLIEEARTNRIVASSAMGTSPWSTDNATLAVDTVLGPDGLTSADTLTEGSSADLHTLYQDYITYTASQPHTLSVFAKSNGRERIQLVLPSLAFGTVHSAVFDLTDGTVGFTEGTVSTSIQALPDGWYRCAVTATATTGGETSAHIRLRDTGETSDYTGNGTSGVHLWGAQLEQGAGVSSYIPTTDATVTRSAEQVSLPLSAHVFNRLEGTILATGTALAGTTPALVTISDGTTGNRFAVTLDPDGGTAGFDVVTSGSSVAALTRPGVVTGQEARCAAAYAADDFALSLDGSGVAEDTAGALPSVSTLAVGASATGGHVARCWVRQIGVFPRRLSNDDLRTLTV